LDPFLNQPNPVRPIDPYLPKVQLNVILPPPTINFCIWDSQNVQALFLF